MFEILISLYQSTFVPIIGKQPCVSERTKQTTLAVFFLDAFKTVVVIVNSMWCGNMFSSGGRNWGWWPLL